MVGVVRTAAAPPGTTAAGLSAPGLEVCGWGNAMVAFRRGQIAGNMDMGVPVGIPVPVVGVILAKTTVPDPVCAGNGNRDPRNHDNDQKEHEEENQYPVTVVIIHFAVRCGSIGGVVLCCLGGNADMHRGAFAMVQRAKVPHKIVAVLAVVIGLDTVQRHPADGQLIHTQIIEPAGGKAVVGVAVLVQQKQMGLVHLERKVYAALCADGGGNIRREVGVDKINLGKGTAVIHGTYVKNCIRRQVDQAVVVAVGQADAHPGQRFIQAAADHVPVQLIGDIGGAIGAGVHCYGIVGDLIHVAVIRMGGQGGGNKQQQNGQHSPQLRGKA